MLLRSHTPNVPKTTLDVCCFLTLGEECDQRWFPFAADCPRLRIVCAGDYRAAGIVHFQHLHVHLDSQVRAPEMRMFCLSA